MKAPFSEKLTLQNKFTPSAQFKTYSEYLADYEERKLAHDSLPDDVSTSEDIELTVVRLGDIRKANGNLSYRYVSGFTPEQMKIALMFGFAERKGTIISSPQMIGAKGVEVKVKAFLGTPITEGDNIGKCQVVFKKSDSARAEQMQLQAKAQSTFAKASAFGITRSVLRADISKELAKLALGEDAPAEVADTPATAK